VSTANGILMVTVLTCTVLNTLSDGGACTVVFQAVTAIIGSESSDQLLRADSDGQSFSPYPEHSTTSLPWE
jgi:hypothetical protein